MGDRASYAIRENGQVELFYGQFSAGALLADIFWGPETCEAMIRDQSGSDEWLDDVFGEAAVAMCKDTRTVAFYDSRYRLDAQQLAARLMSTTWMGWTVRAVRYVSGVAATVGVDLRDKERPLPSFVSDLEDLAPVCGRSLARGGLIEVVRGDQRDQRMVSGELHHHLWHGPRVLDAVPLMTPIADVRAGLASRFESDGSLMPLLDRNAGIATIDVDRRTLDVTYRATSSASHAYAFTGAAATRWPGWTVRREIGTAADHFSRLGQPTSPDLEHPDAPPRSLIEQVRELAGGLFATEARTEEAGERLQRFRTLVATLELGDIAERDALEHARRGGGKQPTTEPELELGPWRGKPALSVWRKGEIAFALSRPEEEAPVLLGWDDVRRPPRVICKIVDQPRPDYTTGFTLAPSRRACAVVLSRGDLHEVYWIDIATGSAKRIAESSPLAKVSYDTNVLWEPTQDRDRLAFGVLDERALDGIGETVVVVYDGIDGYVGEHRGAAVARWSDAGLLVQRAMTTGNRYTVDVQPFTSTASPELVRARMLGDAPDIVAQAVRRRVSQVEAARRARAANALLSTGDDREPDPSHAAQIALSALELDPTNEDAFYAAWLALDELGDFERLRAISDRHVATALPSSASGWRALAQACNELRDHAEALRAAERAVALAPFNANAHLQHAIALAQGSQLEAAMAACERAIACDRNRNLDVALTRGLDPLWGQPGFRDYDYLRLVENARLTDDLDRAEVRYREAIAFAPELSDAYRGLLELDVDLDTRLELTGRWRTHCSTELEAWVAHTSARIDAHVLDEARTSAAELVERWPDHDAGRSMLARIALDEEGEDDER